MLSKLFSPSREISKEEKEFIEKLSQYLLGNCKYIYGIEYIPRLTQKICRSQKIELEIHKGLLYITQDDKEYKIPYAFNMYKGYIIDLNLFIVKDTYKKKVVERNNQFKEIELFPELPEFLISNFKEKDNQLNGIYNIKYESKKIILNDKFQPTQIGVDDNLLLTVYNDCYADKIAKDIISYTPDKKNIKSYFEIDFIG